jgi:hypothetical protein
MGFLVKKARVVAFVIGMGLFYLWGFALLLLRLREARTNGRLHAGWVQ